MWLNIFNKKNPPLSGAPAIRRLKSYSAQSGYVYRYFYEGHRPNSNGVEFVFQASPDNKAAYPVSVLVEDAALRAWELSHSRDLSPTERYAIAKMALFQAFDERPTPELMKQEVRVRSSDVEVLAAILGFAD
jgi:hypothetical protein